MRGDVKSLVRLDYSLIREVELTVEKNGQRNKAEDYVPDVQRAQRQWLSSK